MYMSQQQKTMWNSLVSVLTIIVGAFTVTRKFFIHTSLAECVKLNSLLLINETENYEKPMSIQALIPNRLARRKPSDYFQSVTVSIRIIQIHTCLWVWGFADRVVSHFDGIFSCN